MKDKSKPQEPKVLPPNLKERMAAFAIELGLAGTQVLREDFGFSEDMANTWLRNMIERASRNRQEAAKK